METSSTSILGQVRRLLFQDPLQIGMNAKLAQHTIRAKQSIAKTVEPNSSLSWSTQKCKSNRDDISLVIAN